MSVAPTISVGERALRQLEILFGGLGVVSSTVSVERNRILPLRLAALQPAKNRPIDLVLINLLDGKRNQIGRTLGENGSVDFLHVSVVEIAAADVDRRGAERLALTIAAMDRLVKADKTLGGVVGWAEVMEPDEINLEAAADAVGFETASVPIELQYTTASPAG